MNIKQAKEEIKHTVMAYLSKDEQPNGREGWFGVLKNGTSRHLP